MIRTTLLCCLLACVSLLSAAHEVKADFVTYQDGDLTLKGFLAAPAALAGTAPGVLVVHDWFGCGPYAQQRARELAERGYVAFALDMYGEGRVVTKREDAADLAGGFYKDLPLMVRRAKAGLTVLTTQGTVDKTRLAAIGFCFGGTISLNLARSGEPLAGVVSFHGGLKSATAVPVAEGGLKARVLVLHGGADPFVPPADVAAFMDEMTKAKASWRMETYGGAVHSFSNPTAGDNVASGSAYNVEAEKLSIAAMERFFGEIFAVQ